MNVSKFDIEEYGNCLEESSVTEKVSVHLS